MAVDLRKTNLNPSKMDNHEMMSEIMKTLAAGVVLDGDKSASDAINALMSSEKVRDIVSSLPSKPLSEILFSVKEGEVAEKFSEESREAASNHAAIREERQKNVQDALSQGSKSRG